MVSVGPCGQHNLQQIADLVCVLAKDPGRQPIAAFLSDCFAGARCRSDQTVCKSPPSQATQSISTLAPFGSAATCTQALAGLVPAPKTSA